MRTSTDDTTTTCANCGRGEESTDDLKACTACKMVKYCNRDCQIAHRPQHKRECKKRAAELRDVALFKQPPRRGDCEICFLPLPTLHTGMRYQTCCGKVICCGCLHSVVITSGKNICPFCRSLAPSVEVGKKQERKRIELGDAEAISALGTDYHQGRYGMPQDFAKAFELWQRAGELGCALAYSHIAQSYIQGRGVVRDEKKGMQFMELAAMGGDNSARHNLGVSEWKAGNIGRALKHFMIAVESGNNYSLKTIHQMCVCEQATKDDYAKALGSYQAYLDEIKSDQRDKSAANDVECKYF